MLAPKLASVLLGTSTAFLFLSLLLCGPRCCRCWSYFCSCFCSVSALCDFCAFSPRVIVSASGLEGRLLGGLGGNELGSAIVEGSVDGPASGPLAVDVDDSGAGVPSASDVDAEACLELSADVDAFCASNACSLASKALILLSALYRDVTRSGIVAL